MNKKQIVKTFINLVTIDSPSGQEEKAREYIARELKRMGIKAVKDGFGNLIARVPGSGKPLMFEAHMDTVEPGKGIKPKVKGNLIVSDGTTVLGADDKAGVTAVLEAVRYLQQAKIKHRPLELVFTRMEETGLKGAFSLDTAKFQAREALVVDGSGTLGRITLAAPYIFTIDITIRGKAAHAGVEPEKGISAIQMAAKAVSELKLGRINKATTNNIGTIQGGSVRNSVPEEVKIQAEARSHNLEEAVEQVDIINRAFKKAVRRYRGKLFFKTKLSCTGYNYPGTDKFIREIHAVNKKLGILSRFEKSGGASDANVLVGKKIKAVDISAGYEKMHTTAEFVRVSDLVKLTEFLVEFVRVK